MALLQRLFSSKRLSKGFVDDKGGRRHDHVQKSVPPKLDKSKIRLVIYADSDRGRTPYFDSNAISKVEDINKTGNRSAPRYVRGKDVNYSTHKEASGVQHRHSAKFHFQRLGSDVKVLEEMMFGTVGMAFKGSTLKVHLLRSPPQLMVSKVFIPEKPCKESIGDGESDSNSLPSSSADFSSEEFSLIPLRKPKEKYARSIPVDVPTNDFMSDCSTDDDSGLASFTSSGSLSASFPSPSNSSASSYNSLHRRWMRAQITAFDGQHRKHDLESHISERSVTRPKRNKLAIGILFGSYDEKDEDSNNLFQSFFFSHFALVEGHVERLRSVVERAYFNHRHFLPATMEALEAFRDDLYDLYMAPRLPEPVWLSMMSTATYRTRLCEKFMQEFTYLVAKYDNKNCKFFMSTLLSAVLTQHLAWVATVTPAGGTPSRTYLDKHSAKWVDTLAKTHPYNPLWAQLGDLFGAIGLPMKISRTVVIGRKADIVKKFLYILSYFIRCSDVHEVSDLECLSQLINDTNFDLSLSPCESETGLPPDHSTSPCVVPLLTRQTSTPCTASSASDSHVVKANSGGVLKSKHGDCTVPRAGCECVNKSQSEPSCFYECVGRSRTSLSYLCDTGVSKAGCEERPQCCRLLGHTQQCVSGVDAHFLSNPGNQEQTIPVLSSEKSDLSSKVPMSGSDISALCDTPAGSSACSATEAMSELHIFPPSSLPMCSLTTTNVIESPSRERVVRVHKGDYSFNKSPAFPLSSGEPILRSQSFSDARVKSRLSQQLEYETLDHSGESKQILMTSDARKIFLSQGSNSMFEEYFEPGVVAKTIDDLSESEKVILSSSASSTVSSRGDGSKDNKSVKLSRHCSHEPKGSATRPTSLSKCRPTTPTELSHRRHRSSTSSIDYEAFDPMIHCKELKMPEPLAESGPWNVKAFDRNFGRSLLAGYTDHYMSDFVLHGTSDTDFKSRLLNDLQLTMQYSILDEPIDEAVCVIADTDNWTVEVASSKVLGISPSGCTQWTSSQLVADLIESVVGVWKLKMSAEFCLMHLEDRLQEIYFKSLVLSEYMRGVSTYNQRELTSMLGFESSDMPLLLAIAGTHTRA